MRHVNCRYLAHAIVCLILIYIFWPDGIATTADALDYMARAVEYSRGEYMTLYNDGNLAWERRPVYPFLVSLLFRWFGVDMQLAIIPVRLAYVALLTSVYVFFIVLKKPYALSVFAFLYALTLTPLSQPSTYLLLDIPLTAISILSFMVVYLGLVRDWDTRKKLLAAITGGLLVSVATLTKEFAVLGGFVPALFFISSKSLQTRANLKFLGAYYAVVLIIVGGWGYGAYLYDHRPPLGLEFLGLAINVWINAAGLGEEMHISTAFFASELFDRPEFIRIEWQDLMGQDILRPLLVAIGQIFTSYYEDLFQNAVALAWLFPVSLIVLTLFAVYKRDKLAIWLLCCYVAYLPVIVIQGVFFWGVRQNAVIYALFTLSLGVCLAYLYQMLGGFLKRSKWIFPNITIACLGGFLVFANFFLGPQPYKILAFSAKGEFVNSNHHYGYATGSNLPFYYTPIWGVLDNESAELGNWISEANCSRVMTVNFQYYKSIRTFSAGPAESPSQTFLLQPEIPYVDTPMQTLPISLVLPSEQRPSWYSEERLLGALEEHQIDCVLIDPRNDYMRSYFLTHPDAQLIGYLHNQRYSLHTVANIISANPNLAPTIQVDSKKLPVEDELLSNLGKIFPATFVQDLKCVENCKYTRFSP